MDASTWILASCRWAEIERASPWFTVEDPRGGTTQFDAGAECIDKSCVPNNWTGSEADWDSYSQFLVEYYGTNDWKQILDRLMKDEIVPVMIGSEVKMVCRDDKGVHRPCAAAWLSSISVFG